MASHGGAFKERGEVKKETAKQLEDRHAAKVARNLIRQTGENRRWIKKLRKLGASDYEIAQALGISEDSIYLKE